MQEIVSALNKLAETQVVARGIISGNKRLSKLFRVELELLTAAEGFLVQVDYTYDLSVPAPHFLGAGEVCCDPVEGSMRPRVSRWRKERSDYVSPNGIVVVVHASIGMNSRTGHALTDWRFLQVLPLAIHSLQGKLFESHGCFATGPARDAGHAAHSRLMELLRQQNEKHAEARALLAGLDI